MRGTTYWIHNEYYIQLKDKVGQYAAVSIIGAQARALSKLYHGQISHAEALSWILSGEKPKSVDNIVDEATRRDRRIALWLNDICDVDVRDTVLSCINSSLHVHNLTYIYKDGLSSAKQARVRILTRMLWDYIH